ncbi:MAG: hypothetical protein GC186_08820 [Rhodobacteraceae bacterium]|nr:hypothetical protein [Paracoccaceae bacterium]
MKKSFDSGAVALVSVAGVFATLTTAAHATPDSTTVVTGQSVLERVLNSTDASSLLPTTGVFANVAENLPVVGTDGILNRIDGSVTNTMSTVDGVNAQVGTTVDQVIGQVYFVLGNISTTVLGAVNTGTITLGASSSAQDAASGASEAVRNATTQIGGTAGISQVALNVASNASDVLGNVTNRFSGASGTIGTISTTVLGAVNTGTITSGVTAATNGIVAGIVGTASGN